MSDIELNKDSYPLNVPQFEQRLTIGLNQTLNVIGAALEKELTHVYGKVMWEGNSYEKELIYTLFSTLEELEQKEVKYSDRDIIHMINLLEKSKDEKSLAKSKEEIIKFYSHKELILCTNDGKRIYAKTLVQKNYLELLNKSSILFVTGSAGTGKTYLAVAYAVNCLKKNEIKKIIITRPAVEAGEKLGFLPGDLKEKVDPYLIPIYDCLNEFLGQETVEKLIEKKVIEIAPLAYMRGRTLDNAIIILDEAQNTTRNQMKMFITRLGFNSKMIITGDLSQIDLSYGEKSGLKEATVLLKGINGINHLHFTKLDVMRHPLVSKIIDRYEEHENDSL